MKSDIIYLKKLELFKELDNFKEGQFFAVADQKVKNHLPQWIQFSPHVFWLKNPEEEKNLDYYGQAVDFFLRQGILRSSTLYAFGGGAATDFTGFIAATILRGIDWVAVPTTLLAMVDGSIGGKVAVNTSKGKNLVGAFHLPNKIYICSDFLSTLSDKEWISGKGEVLKYGFLSKEISDLILKQAPMEEIARACIAYKCGVVERDYREKNERIFLNLGHTLGHAFEFSLKIPHGHAVIMGLKYLFQIFDQDMQLLEWEKMAKALLLPLEKFDLGNFPQFSPQDFISYIEKDKKKNNPKLRLVLVKSIGFCYLEEVSIKDFKLKMQNHVDFRN